MVPPLFTLLVCYVLQVFLNIHLTLSFHRWRQYISHRYHFRIKPLTWEKWFPHSWDFCCHFCSQLQAQVLWEHTKKGSQTGNPEPFHYEQEIELKTDNEMLTICNSGMGPYRELRTEGKLWEFRNLFVCFNYVELKYPDKYQVSPQPEVEVVIS